MDFTTTISDLTGFLAIILDLQRKNDDGEIAQASLHHKLKGELVFRGHEDKDYKLSPSIARSIPNGSGETYLSHEHNIIASLQLALPDVFCETFSPIELLALLQHFSAPTRVLDVTENPLVALYFACQKGTPKDKLYPDGEVIVFFNNPHENIALCELNAIAETHLYFDENNDPIFLQRYITNVVKSPYAKRVGLKDHINQRMLSFSNLSGSPHSQAETAIVSEWLSGGPWLVNSAIHAKRQEMQRGKYILFPNRYVDLEDGSEPYIDPQIDEIKKAPEQKRLYVCYRIIIPEVSKKRLLQELDLIGINESLLFPENIESACKTIVSRSIDK